MLDSMRDARKESVGLVKSICRAVHATGLTLEQEEWFLEVVLQANTGGGLHGVESLISYDMPSCENCELVIQLLDVSELDSYSFLS